MSKIDKQQKSKKKRLFLSILASSLAFIIVGAFIWYNYIYNPIDRTIQGKDYGILYDTYYQLCIDMEYTSERIMILKGPYCRCVAGKLADGLYDKVIRRKEEIKKLEEAYVTCHDETKFTTVSNGVLLEQFEKRCKLGFGAHQNKFCECMANIAVYWIRTYSYESAIELHIKDIINKASDSCIDYYVKAEKHGK